jgi:hypothetical protein
MVLNAAEPQFVEIQFGRGRLLVAVSFRGMDKPHAASGRSRRRRRPSLRRRVFGIGSTRKGARTAHLVFPCVTVNLSL